MPMWLELGVSMLYKWASTSPSSPRALERYAEHTRDFRLKSVLSGRRSRTISLSTISKRRMVGILTAPSVSDGQVAFGVQIGYRSYDGG